MEQTSKFPMVPLHDRVIVKPDAADTVSAGGIIIPDTVKEKPQRGTVIAAGPGRSKEDPMSVKVGDKVMYSKYGGTEINIENEDYLIMRESDILVVLPNEDYRITGESDVKVKLPSQE